MTISRSKALNWQKAPLIEPGSKILRYLELLGVHGAVLHLLGHTPEQYEDVYVVLIDGNRVVSFEVSHDGSKPAEVEFVDFETYRRSTRGVAAKELKSALEEAHELLGKSK
jgi:hypothetical protein